MALGGVALGTPRPSEPKAGASGSVVGCLLALGRRPTPECGGRVLAWANCEPEEACELSIGGESQPVVETSDLTIAELRDAMALSTG
jgi:hypothetical protein